jgi:hypothetical protein
MLGMSMLMGQIWHDEQLRQPQMVLSLDAASIPSFTDASMKLRGLNWFIRNAGHTDVHLEHW